jgi:Bifunctional DNA primase/polymerase, N-terminal
MAIPSNRVTRPIRTGLREPTSHPRPTVTGRLGEVAAGYAARGLAVLPLYHPVRKPGGWWGCSCDDRPCRNIGKHPRTWHGLNDASCDPAQVARWWRWWPLANIGLVCGDRFDVLDVDGPAGVEALCRLLDAEQATMGEGPLVLTGGGGWHYYLAPTGRGNAQPVPGLVHVDWRGRGGYVVAPPRRHATGARYRWERPLTDEVPTVPAALLTLLTPPAPPRRPVVVHRPVVAPRGYAQAALAAECAAVATTSPGGRNWRLWEASRNVYNFVAAGLLDDEDVETALLAAAEACQLLEDEPVQTHRTIRSGRQVGLAHPRGAPNQPRQ